MLTGLLVWLAFGAFRDAFKILAALRNGILMTGQVHVVGSPSRYGQSGSVRVQIGGHLVEKLFSWSGSPLEYEDWVQVLVDPDPGNQWVALMLGPDPRPLAQA
jgi:hypothetical protein